MSIKFTSFVAAIVFNCLLSPIAHADNFSDIMDVLNQISGVEKDMYKLQNTQGIPNLQDINKYTQGQLDLNTQEWAALTKAYNMSKPTAHPIAAELWSADDWDGALKTASGGNSTRYQELKTAYATKNPTLTNHNTQNIDTNALVQNSYIQKADTANTALAASQYTYEDVNQRIRNLQDLIALIDDPAKNANEKAAIDLNSRLVAEVGLMQAQMLRLQSIQVQMQGVDAQDDVNHDTIEKRMLGYQINP